jgi:hypothetical protein
MNYDLLSGYTEMAADLSRECEAVEWCEALVFDSFSEDGNDPGWERN